MKKQLGELKENPERWDAHTVINQIDGLRDGELALVIDCGYQDFFYRVNMNLHEKLMARFSDAPRRTQLRLLVQLAPLSGALFPPLFPAADTSELKRRREPCGLSPSFQ